MAEGGDGEAVCDLTFGIVSWCTKTEKERKKNKAHRKKEEKLICWWSDSRYVLERKALKGYARNSDELKYFFGREMV